MQPSARPHLTRAAVRRPYEAIDCLDGAGVALALFAAGSASHADARGRYWSADQPITFVERQDMAPEERAETEAATRAHHPVRCSATHRRGYNPHHRPLSFASYRPARTTAEYTTESPAATEYAANTYAVNEGVMGHELYQLGDAWYMLDGDTWCPAHASGHFHPVPGFGTIQVCP